MPWRTEEVYNKAFELIDAASPFPWPAGLDVMMDFEMYKKIFDFLSFETNFKLMQSNEIRVEQPSPRAQYPRLLVSFLPG